MIPGTTRNSDGLEAFTCSLKHLESRIKWLQKALERRYKIVNKVLNEIWNLYVRDLALTKSIFFLSNYSENEKYNYVLGCFLDIVRFHIWQAKLNKSIPATQKIKSEVEYSLYTFLKLGHRRIDFNDCPIFQNGRDGHHQWRNHP